MTERKDSVEESSPTLLQINFQHRPPSLLEAQKAALERAHAIAKVPGLIWKVWIFSIKRQEAGGIYLFRDEVSARAYLDGEIITKLKKSPGVGEMHIKVFEVNEVNSAITRAPIY